MPRFVSALAAVVLCLAPLVAHAAEPPVQPSAAAQAKVDAFMGMLKAGKVTDAYNGAFAGTLMSKKQADLEQMIASTETGLRYYGAVRDWKLIEARHPADGFSIATYLLRVENGPLFVRFQFYDNGTRMIVFNIALSDNYDQLKTW